ncbi:MAG: hypothetical protein AB7G06_09600 [Bdellovibrionales bacterium]
MGTLVCCALPALLVTLGAGATLIGLVGTVPWLITLSRYKEITFSVAAVMLIIAGIMQWRARHAPCPVDPVAAKACTRLRRFSLWVYGVSVVLYLTGAFFAFLAADLLL